YDRCSGSFAPGSPGSPGSSQPDLPDTDTKDPEHRSYAKEHTQLYKIALPVHRGISPMFGAKRPRTSVICHGELAMRSCIVGYAPLRTCQTLNEKSTMIILNISQHHNDKR